MKRSEKKIANEDVEMIDESTTTLDKNDVPSKTLFLTRSKIRKEQEEAKGHKTLGEKKKKVKPVVASKVIKQIDEKVYLVKKQSKK